jgi:hypothetical protein
VNIYIAILKIGDSHRCHENEVVILSKTNITIFITFGQFMDTIFLNDTVHVVF